MKEFVYHEGGRPENLDELKEKLLASKDHIQGFLYECLLQLLSLIPDCCVRTSA